MGAAPFLGVVPVDPALGLGPDASLLEARSWADQLTLVARLRHRADQDDAPIRLVLPDTLVGEAEGISRRLRSGPARREQTRDQYRGDQQRR